MTSTSAPPVAIHGSADVLCVCGSPFAASAASEQRAGVAVVLADAAPTVNVKSPDTGCPSCDTTRHNTCTGPVTSVASSFWVTTLSWTFTTPFCSGVHDASKTFTWFAFAPPATTTSLNVRVTDGGRADTVAPSAGLVDTSWSWADAGAATAKTAAAATASAAAAPARRLRTGDVGEGKLRRVTLCQPTRRHPGGPARGRDPSDEGEMSVPVCGIGSDSLDGGRATVDEHRQAGADEVRRSQRAGAQTPVSTDTTQTFAHESDLSFVPFGSALSDAELAAIDALPSGAALLIVRSGPTAGARYLLDTDVSTVGRHPDADIFFDDVTVSRRHAEVTRHGTGFEIVDQRSLNGTYVNGTRVDRADLVNGAEVRIGKFRLNFFVSPADLAPHAGE